MMSEGDDLQSLEMCGKQVSEACRCFRNMQTGQAGFGEADREFVIILLHGLIVH